MSGLIILIVVALLCGTGWHMGGKRARREAAIDEFLKEHVTKK